MYQRFRIIEKKGNKNDLYLNFRYGFRTEEQSLENRNVLTNRSRDRVRALTQVIQIVVKMGTTIAMALMATQMATQIM